jgi:hypothetical protein
MGWDGVRLVWRRKQLAAIELFDPVIWLQRHP